MVLYIGAGETIEFAIIRSLIAATVEGLKRVYIENRIVLFAHNIKIYNTVVRVYRRYVFANGGQMCTIIRLPYDTASVRE